MRPLLVRLHRWFGLTAAVFLFVSGLTGSIIAWNHEIDAWLNPSFFAAPTAGPPLSASELAARLEKAEPQLRVRYLPLAVEPGKALLVYVEARPDPKTGIPHPLAYSQVALDPVSGAVLGRRDWGKFSLARENLLPFLYKLHYSLHLPTVEGWETGTLFMGGLAIAWVIDCFVALWISFPSLRSWRQSFAFRWKAGGYRLKFDLHRSGGVWLFPLLLVLATSSVAMNLRDPVARPFVSLFSKLSPSPFEVAARQRTQPPRPAMLGYAAIELRARQEAARRGWRSPPGGIFAASQAGLYGVGFFAPGEEGRLGTPWLYFDANDGRLLASEIPGQGTRGDLVLQAMYPLHSGRILGTPGRILVSGCGLAVAGLSLTGLVIWARKRRARQSKALKARLV